MSTLIYFEQNNSKHYLCSMHERLKAILKDKGLTQLQLAEMLNITYQSLYQRLKNPTLESIKEIASVLNCEVSDLLGTSKKIQLIINDELHIFYNIKELRDFLEENKSEK